MQVKIVALNIDGEKLTMDNVWGVAHGHFKVKLDESCLDKMKKSRAVVDSFLKSGKTVYGVNTGFGPLSAVSISPDQISQLQLNLVRSHSVGIGDLFSREEVRAILLLRANALARGHCGVRVEVVEKILEFLNNDIIPAVPSQGSVGASGDLAPLAHVALSLIGEGEVLVDGQKIPTEKVLKEKNIKPIVLQAKEGLSLINGCQVMTAVGLLNLYRAKRLNHLADLAGAMTVEAMHGSRAAFDPLIAASRPHPGEAETANAILGHLGEQSEIGDSHAGCGRVQDAYSLRCIPQVHGAAKDAYAYAIKVLETEANSSTDNPLVFADEGKVLSCGNFHGMPVAFAMDFVCIATTAMASICERRIEKLTTPAFSELPAFLAKNGGLNSGMMIVQYAAASLVSESKVLSHPASVDSIPTSAGKEDHVSMGTIAARKFGQIVRNAENVVAMEFLCAAQALDLLKPLKPAAGVEKAYSFIRKNVSFAEVDRVFSKDIETIRGLIQSGTFYHYLKLEIGNINL